MYVSSGVCGKQQETAALQDNLLQCCALALAATMPMRPVSRGKSDPEIDNFMLEGLFATVTQRGLRPETFGKSHCSLL